MGDTAADTLPEPTAEETVPDCSASYATADALLNETKFDDDNGSIFLIGGDDCAAGHLKAFNIRNGRMKVMKEKWYEKRAAQQAKKAANQPDLPDKPDPKKPI